MRAFIVKVTNDEVFRADVAANPAETLAGWDLDEEERRSIREDNAWAWLRDLSEEPEKWRAA